MGWYGWMATAICLTGTVINVKRGNACFLFWTIGEILWLAYDIGIGFGSRAILDFTGLALAVWGIWENIVKPKKGKTR